MAAKTSKNYTAIDGACHCENIRFILRWPGAVTEIPVRQCGCTFCQKHQGAWTSHQDATLGVDFEDATLVSKYRFGTKTADFCVCAVCGVVPFVLSEIDSRQHAVVNVNAFEHSGGYSFAVSSTNFDGEQTQGRLERRKRNWISRVEFIDCITR